MDKIKLFRDINSNYFDYQKLSNSLKKSSHVRRDIGKLIQNKDIIRIKKGLYTWGETLRAKPYAVEVISNLIFGPSYISLEYALSHYRLIPERVNVITAVTTQRKKKFETEIGTFEYEHLHKKAFPWGVVQIKRNENDVFMIATPEKALLDYIALRLKKWDKNIKYQEILFDDLRFETKEFENFNKEKIKKLARYYKSSSVKHFAQQITMKG